MGQYKVPQNVEAEDHILGPLTFKQFIYMMVGGGWAILCFAVFRTVPFAMVVIGLPPTLLFLLLAFFRRDGQDFEHLLVAMVGFFSATHYRLWVKEPVAETFHITPTPQTAEISQRNPAQVISELEKLATLIDSRGWNIPVSQDTGSHLTMPTTQHQERIVAPVAPKPTANDAPHSDMLDLQHSPLAQDLSKLLEQSAAEVRQQAVAQMTNPAPAQAGMPAPAAAVAAGTAATSQVPITASVSHFTNPAAAPSVAPAPAYAPTQPLQSISGVTAAPSNDILRLATQSEGLSVASVAAQATRINPMTVPLTPAAPAPAAPTAPSGPMVEQQ
ncbi:MAG TPA: PrgI family protein [Candidatus Saccharimonadia bacterium]